MARLTLNEIAARAEQFSERLRTTRALKEALRIIAANICDASAPSPPETPAPVHYLARYAAGSFTACDPTIKDGWTTDPLGVTCEECRKVVRWRCEQVPAPETPASEGRGIPIERLGEYLKRGGFRVEIVPPASPASAPSRGTDHDPGEMDCTCIAPHPACPNCNGTGRYQR